MDCSGAAPESPTSVQFGQVAGSQSRCLEREFRSVQLQLTYRIEVRKIQGKLCYGSIYFPLNITFPRTLTYIFLLAHMLDNGCDFYQILGPKGRRPRLYHLTQAGDAI